LQKYFFIGNDFKITFLKSSLYHTGAVSKCQRRAGFREKSGIQPSVREIEAKYHCKTAKFKAAFPKTEALRKLFY
jgi:hypothetical protein